MRIFTTTPHNPKETFEQRTKPIHFYAIQFSVSNRTFLFPIRLVSITFLCPLMTHFRQTNYSVNFLHRISGSCTKNIERKVFFFEMECLACYTFRCIMNKLCTCTTCTLPKNYCFYGSYIRALSD